MNGQWIGRYTGSSSGFIVIEIDDMGSHYEGVAYAYDDAPNMPSVYAIIRTVDKKSSVTLTLDINPLDPRTYDPTSWGQIGGHFPGVSFPLKAEVTLRLAGQILNVDWKTDVQSFGSSVITKSQADKPSEYVPIPHVSNWEAFKGYVNGLDYRRFIFRGQSVNNRLRTSFHRTGRADLTRFMIQDISALYRHLSTRTRHIFNRNIPEENGAFFNMVQHHGYPTPLLDWTYSPFVSAFFAYHRTKNSDAEKAADEKKVRIFVFDQKSWCNDFIQFQKITPARLHFSITEFVAINNERVIPQQALSSVTNIDDIETFIRSHETPQKQYLHVIDLPLKERPKVMRELSIMGITAGSLFPGLDGACEELRERFFEL